jgi:purine-binding chemotaxis protein CheW
MRARRFRAEEDYFGKKSRLPDEIIGSEGTSSTGNSQDAPLVSDEDRDAEAESPDRTPLKRDRHTYLAFRLRGQGYVIKTPKVKEIIRQMRITPIPRTPGYVKGVINLRDRVIPVVDLGLKLAMEAAVFTEHTCIIVVEVTGSTGPYPMGIIVDSVSEVMNINAYQIQDTSVFGVRADTSYISGMALLEEGVSVVLNIDRMLEEGTEVGAGS